MARVLSGIQPSGALHLGNYLGAVRPWVTVDQHQNDSLFMMADLHALTLPWEKPTDLAQNTLELATVFVAAGLDPNLCTLFVQSQVPEHARLSWLLENTVSIGQLRRMTQFKDKAQKGGEESARAGLFTYPVLQSADILLYDANKVPVGEDQRQHVELTRDIAQRFNHLYGETFVIPEIGVPTEGARVMDLQEPTKKMSKSTDSDAGCIYLLDPPGVIEKKFKRAVTDTENDVAYDREKRPGVANLLDILSAVTGDKPEALANNYSQYGPLKADVAAAVIDAVTPIQKRYGELSVDPGEMHNVLAKGREKARAIATPTYERAAKHMGLLSGE